MSSSLLKDLRDKLVAEVPDPRRVTYGHVLHAFGDIVMIALFAIHSGCTTYEAYRNYAVDHIHWFSSFLELKNGVPGPDTIRRCLTKTSTEALSRS